MKQTLKTFSLSLALLTAITTPAYANYASGMACIAQFQNQLPQYPQFLAQQQQLQQQVNADVQQQIKIWQAQNVATAPQWVQQQIEGEGQRYLSSSLMSWLEQTLTQLPTGNVKTGLEKCVPVIEMPS